MNEWEFIGVVASWIKERIQKNPSLPFSDARIEQRGQGALKRRDLTLLDKNKVPVLTGEVKLPYAKDGSIEGSRFHHLRLGYWHNILLGAFRFVNSGRLQTKEPEETPMVPKHGCSAIGRNWN